jgi:deoxyinosine 3'endonuclease (endonuclease V)
MAAHDVNLADAHAEMVRHELADGNIGLVVDWGGYDADYETARSIPADLVPASPGDHSYLETLVVCPHETPPYVPGFTRASWSPEWESNPRPTHLRGRSRTSGP